MDWSLFKRAIADNEDPTPGFIYRDMAQWTFKDYNTQMKLINALFEKLKPTTSVHVLHKVLRIIKMTCETGHGDFQKEMQKNNRVEEIKVFANYRGKPDTKHGDSLNERVRQSARDAMEAIFTHHRGEHLTIEAGHGGGIYGGGVTTARSDFTTGNFTAPTVMGGAIGLYSNNIAPMPTTNKWAGHMTEQAVAGNTSMTSRMLSTLAEKAKNGFGILQNPVGGTKYQSAKDQLYESALKLSVTGSTMPLESSVANTGAFQPVEVNTSLPLFLGDDKPRSGWRFAEEVERLHDTAEQGAGGGGGGDVCHQQNPNPHRKQLTPLQSCVQRLCQMKHTPQRVELHSFVTQCREVGSAMMRQRDGRLDMVGQEEMMDCWEELAEALDAELAQQHPWQRRFNALLALEAILNPRGDAHGNDADVEMTMRRGVMEYFLENPEDVRRNVSVVQATLRESAQRVLKLLGLTERNVVVTAGGGYGNNNNSSSSTSSGNGGGCPYLAASATTTVGVSSPFAPMAEAHQIQGVGNTAQTFTWSTPVSQASATMGCNGGGRSSAGQGSAADLSGMAVRVNPLKSRDKTTLRKRAPMRLAEGALVEDTGSTNGSHSGHVVDETKCGGSACFFPTMSSTPNGGNHNRSGSVMDDLFNGPASSEEGKSALSTSFYAGIAAAPSVAQTDATSVSHSSGTGVFDFLTAGKKEESLAPFVPPLSHQQQQQQHQPFCFDGASHSSVSPILCVPPSTSSGCSGDKRGGNGTVPSASGAVISNFPASTPVDVGTPSAVLVQMQQQLQTLMNSLQHNSNPAALEQLQALVAQQQQLVLLMSQQQAPRNAPSHDGKCNNHADMVSTHSHFMTGATPTTPSAAMSSFAAIHHEMMTRMAAQKPQ